MTPVQNTKGPNQQPITSGTIMAFRFRGTPVRLHFTFTLFMVFVAVSVLGSLHPNANYAVFLVGSLVSVLLHELGHATVASKFGVRTAEIVMFPIGGLARMESPLPPAAEIWVALAGPVVNLVLAASAFGYLMLTHGAAMITLSDLLHPNGKNAMSLLLYGNIVLAAFNLIPAYPMDGGRILRGLLSFLWPAEKATRVATWTGRMLAISMCFYGLLASQFLLVFFALFIYLGAAQEGVAVMGRTLSHGIPTRAVMITHFHTLGHGANLRDVAQLRMSTTQHDFPVLHGDQVVGLVGRKSFPRALATEGPDAYVAGVMDRDFLELDPNDDLAEVLPLMAHSGGCALVMEKGRLLGLLPSDHLSEFLQLRRSGLEPGI